MSDSSGWIIQHARSHPTSPMYFKIGSFWTPERDLALRFARKEDADGFLRGSGMENQWHILVEFKPTDRYEIGWKRSTVMLDGKPHEVVIASSDGDSDDKVEHRERAFAPHCDARVLHAPGKCVHCDKYDDWQAYRQLAHIAFTGVPPKSDEIACPSDFHRGLAGAHVWGGNCPRPHGKGGFSGPLMDAGGEPSGHQSTEVRQEKKS